MYLNHLEGGRRVVEAVHDSNLVEWFFLNDFTSLQHTSNFGLSLVAIMPDHVDLLVKVGRRGGCYSIPQWRF